MSVQEFMVELLSDRVSCNTYTQCKLRDIISNDYWNYCNNNEPISIEEYVEGYGCDDHESNVIDQIKEVFDF